MSSDQEASPRPQRTSPLRNLHRRLGANLAPYRGTCAAADYGDEPAEREALRSACGLIERPWASGLEMLGEDRARFLGGFITCDVEHLEPGGGVYGLVTDVKGKVLADLVVLALEDRLWLELPPGRAQEISEHLSKYVIADRVEIRPLEGVIPMSLIGPRSAEVLGAEDQPEAAAWNHRTVDMLGTEVRLVREPPFAVPGRGFPQRGTDRRIPGCTIWAPEVSAQAFLGKMLESGRGGLVPVGHRAYDALRVAAGRPVYGLDFDAGNFPQETGLEEQTVSYTKGCYLGQEVVARIHYRGVVNRHLRGLLMGDDAGEPVGRAVLVGGREAGTVTSAATLAGGTRIGLAILHRRAEPGTDVELAGGGTARVVELPFPAP